MTNSTPLGSKDDIKALMDALKKARETIVEQSNKLDELTSPPFMYATVVALSGWRDNRTSSKNTYTDTMGDKIIIDTKTKSLFGFHLGDILNFIDGEENSRVLEAIKKAKKLVVVGFLIDKKVVVQIDDDIVVVDIPEVIRTVFRVVEIGQIGMINTAVMRTESTYYEAIIPKGFNINPGDTVTVVRETMQIVDVASVQICGDIGHVSQVIDENFVEIDYQSANRIVFSGRYSKSLERGDKVVLDQTASVIVGNLGKEEARFRFALEANVEWEDIGGLENAKAQMIEAVELPYRNPHIIKFYNRRPIKGVLLYGPPGCGKTMLGKATATSIARMNVSDTKHNGFLYIKGPEILERFVGVAEAVVRQLFQRARKHKEQFGFPAVIFIDEAEALLSRRGSGISSDVEKTMVPMFCTEMDGMEESGALVILATNRPDILDPAIIRNGRIDRKIKIERPTIESAVNIFTLNLKDAPLNNGYSHDELAKLGAAELFRRDRILYRIAVKDRGDIDFTLSDIINGGMVAGVVDEAKSIAMKRDIINNVHGGLCREDIVLAVDLIEQQNRDLDHTDELSEFTHDFLGDLVGVKKLCMSVN